ncbi:efflux RND transporter permease subunit [Anaeromyxobacter dehalogenans]|uniref:Acriflavin resistance protein n=1 Tax=Anaeromyxobacter dehalogenans (strain 2CP-C) TaxID=290397 RepID=Q2IGC8_ANADE|nr:efflux RND transporter permease subunit [Anaeromyxobacter dehalogenans]ABC83638.1 Acriflavin resistance protein [Anaeromyxobacter dehalogenans 2CP-C]
MTTSGPRLGLPGRLARAFLHSKLTPLLVVASLALGVAAVMLTPREEEPQIVVPLVDVLVPFPGATAREVESQLTTPLERRLWGLPGVEYLYSTSMPSAALVTVRFKVNEPLEPSLVKVHHELHAHPELLPAGALPPVVRALGIDDVPFLTLTLHGEPLPAGQLRTLGEEVARELAAVPETAQVRVLGGARRVVRVEPQPDRLRTLGVSIAELQPALAAAQGQLPAGALVDAGARVQVEADGFVRSARDLRRVVVAVRGDRPVYLEDVARVTDGPEPEPAVVLMAERGKAGFEQAVSIALAKRPGANAPEVARAVERKVAALRGGLIPAPVKATVTRNYGDTAEEKSNELIEHLLLATLSVVALIALAMGWRSALVVGVAIPVTLALTLLPTYLLGYTLNRVTLFALIFSIGILVDDAIVVVENIHRHLHLPGPRRGLVRTVVDAVDEVGNPTILATFAVIAAIVPMAFVRGPSGPYMRPIPVGASAAMLISLAIAFVISPWAARKVFREEAEGARAVTAPLRGPAPETLPTRLYRRVIGTLLTRAWSRWAFLALVLLLLAGAVSLVAFGAIQVKMLPFDNKRELQVQLDLPAGTAREEALAAGQALARRVLEEPEVKDVQVHSGVAAPFTFVGMVRHSFLREGAEQVDLQVNLVPKGERKAQSHAVATRLRPALEAIAWPRGGRLKIVEIPPGPPVLDTLVAEVYGPSAAERDRLAGEVLAAFRATRGVVDVDSSLAPTSPRLTLRLDAEKAALHGVAPAAVIQTLAAAGAGASLGSFHVERGAAQVPVVLQLAPAQRARVDDLLQLTVPGRGGPVPLSELVRAEEGRVDPPVFHENLMPVAYVFGDLAGEIESPVYALAQLNRRLDALRGNGGEVVPRLGFAHPDSTERPVIKWDGEWHITLEVFRDLGIAFAVVLVVIYFLVVGWFQSLAVPWVILVPIPLSLIGILPAHLGLGAFFTATSMIGFIAGAGIIVRNSIILVDFIELKLREGMPLAAAVEEAGVVRFRPMLLTAAAVLVGSAVMLADPIFQGLAVSLMAGEVAATLLSRLAVPVLYFLVARRGRAAQLRREGAAERARRGDVAEGPAHAGVAPVALEGSGS